MDLWNIVSAILLFSLTQKMVRGRDVFQPESENKYCGGKPADLVFVMDSSGSIGNLDFEYQKEFVKGTIELFDIDSGKIRVGVVSYSNWAFPEFQLNAFSQKQAILDAVDQVTHFKGDTNTGATLEYLSSVMFKTHNGARDGVPHIAIVLTDGRSNDPWYTMQQARIAKEQGITLFALGVGHDMFEYELEVIASSPSSKYLFRVGDFMALQYIKEILAIEACQVPPPTIRVDVQDQQTTTTAATTTTTTQKPRLCQNADSVDLVFSTAPGATPDDVKSTLGFFREVSSGLDIGMDKIRVSLVPENCHELPDIQINHQDKLEDALQGLDSLIDEQNKSLSNVFNYIRKKSLHPKNGARKSTIDSVVQKIAVVVLDSFDNYKSAKKESHRLQKEGVKVVVVAIGVDKDNRRMVFNLASEQPANNVFFLDSYKELPKYIRDMQKLICPS